MKFNAEQGYVFGVGFFWVVLLGVLWVFWWDFKILQTLHNMEVLN